MKNLIFSLMAYGLIALCLTGCDNMSSAGHSTTPVYPIPTSVVWNGITFETKGELSKEQLDHILGVINHHKTKYPVYSVKGHRTTEEIAIEVHNPNKQFVEAVKQK